MVKVMTGKKVLFVNKFGPASNAITGQTGKELADFLHDQGCEVEFLCLQAIYRANAKPPEGAQVRYKITSLRDFYNGDSAFLRLFMSFFDGFRLCFRALN